MDLLFCFIFVLNEIARAQFLFMHKKYYKNNVNNYNDEMDSTGSHLTFISAMPNYCDLQGIK